MGDTVKRAGRRAKWIKILASRIAFSGTFVRCQSEVIRCLWQASIPKILVLEQNGVKFGLGHSRNIYRVYLTD